MKALIEGKPIQPSQLFLDDFGWDHHDVHGDKALDLALDENDLEAISRHIFKFFEECIADDPRFFDEAHMKDVPVPKSGRLFVEQPQLLNDYFTESFWRHEMAVALVDRAAKQSPEGAGKVQQGPANDNQRFLIQDFRELKMDKNRATLRLGGKFL
ncbi:MAG: hypothetical protein HY541_00695 [Deltaproteobacteria bacterium]|nr:hypothetical protein [Deltaproteobacteria bacterium]